MSQLHPAAREGFAAAADAYVTGRPGYPPEVDEWLREALRLRACHTVVDLGAGAGHFTRELTEIGLHVIAVEPVAEMRAKLATALPEVDARAGVAEALPLADASVDGLVCAQSFHWFATPAALAEIRRVLKIGGRLGLIWNVRDESVAWVAALSQLIAPYEGDAPRYARLRWRELFPAPGFSKIEMRTFSHFHDGPPERVVIDRVLSTSFVAAQPPEVRREIAAAARAVLARHGVIGERVAFPYQTHAFSCERLS